MAIATVNPSTGQLVKEFSALNPVEIEEKISKSQQVFDQYRLTSFEQRKSWLLKVADILEISRQELGELITLEMGKTLKSAIAEVEKCVIGCRFYAENAADFLAVKDITTDATKSYVTYQPLGIILAVMPWNFPFWQVFRFAAPTLMAGNVGLLKHSSNVPQCALKIEEIFLQAGFAEGVFQTLLITGDQVGQIVADDRIKAATLTGSEYAGSQLATIAGKYLKKTVLELGGSDPFIVFPSADLDLAVNTAVTARLQNNGQSCIASKRFILSREISDRFQEKLLAKYQQLNIGDPLLPDTDIGPLATAKIRDDLHQLVSNAVAVGGKIIIGGQPLTDRLGYFYPPTIITNLPPGYPADTDEFFGPVALLFIVDNIQEAIAKANKIPFGLGASVWTNDPQEIQLSINEIQAGAVFINGMVKSDPRLPFGGIKKSGYGRELGIEGIHEFVNIKTVWIS